MSDGIVMRGMGAPWILNGPGELRGRPLRYLVTTLLSDAGGPLRVRELVDACERVGVVFASRASKVVSDALRWEMRWGRVVRLRRGVCQFARAPRSTWHWIRGRVADIGVYLARVRSQSPAPVLNPLQPPQRRVGFVT